MSHDTREAWLQAAVATLTDRFEALGETVPPVRVSVGWPHRGKPNTIGQCFPPAASEDGASQIFISPVLADGADVLPVLIHELVHAVEQAKGNSGHGKTFAAIAKPLGLVGKMTATTAGDELREYFITLEDQLGPFPHSAMHRGASLGKSRSGSLVKLVCEYDDDMKVSMSKTAIETYGCPLCPCHQEPMLPA